MRDHVPREGSEIDLSMGISPIHLGRLSCEFELPGQISSSPDHQTDFQIVHIIIRRGSFVLQPIQERTTPFALICEARGDAGPCERSKFDLRFDSLLTLVTVQCHAMDQISRYEILSSLAKLRDRVVLRPNSCPTASQLTPNWF